MGNITTYLKKYGKYTFLEEPFNEVDNVILSLISYIDFSDIVPGFDCGSITIKDASKQFYEKFTKKDLKYSIRAIKGSNELLKLLAETERYQNLPLYNYYYQVDFDTQFGALCIGLPDKKVYVSYEGTDNYISGWEEDCRFAYKFPTSCQELAIKYLNNVVGFFGPKVYIGGHSKGGNLALVASMYCKGYIKRKIISVFNNDGPGLRKKEFESKEYKKVLPKLKTILPKESIIGILLRHAEDLVFVDSSDVSIYQHDALTWVVQDKQFKRAKQSDFSRKVEKASLAWLNKLNDEEREKFIKTLFSIFKKADITDLHEFKKAKLNNTLKIIKEIKNISKENKTMITNCLKELFNEMKK